MANLRMSLTLQVLELTSKLKAENEKRVQLEETFAKMKKREEESLDIPKP